MCGRVRVTLTGRNGDSAGQVGQLSTDDYSIVSDADLEQRRNATLTNQVRLPPCARDAPSAYLTNLIR
ncbi:hypothetical protein Rhow_001648 [Rhodococcus wratislaviensis]|uniref:Uncharacterized protein n=1 Tax=Rhodococcus wratislaviensis TaxID=44752 RepID=A0A402BYD0_RHOWR|nr:hypothetical protein Rhow_001648 [Rhodococcus wratislaviensis]